MNKSSEITVSFGIRKYCMWLMAILCLLKLPLPAWMFYLRENKQ